MVNCWARRWGRQAANSMIVMERKWTKGERRRGGCAGSNAARSKGYGFTAGALKEASGTTSRCTLVGRCTPSEAKRFHRDGLAA